MVDEYSAREGLNATNSSEFSLKNSELDLGNSEIREIQSLAWEIKKGPPKKFRVQPGKFVA